MMLRSEKETIVSKIKENIEKANAIFLTNLVGISPNDASRLRKEMRDNGGNVFIARNTLFRRASAGTHCENLLKDLKGPNALAFSFTDAPKIAKILYDASKNLEVIKLKGGVLGQKQITGNEVEALAKLPSRDQMLATLLATFNAPASAFVRCLHAIKEEKEKATA